MARHVKKRRDGIYTCDWRVEGNQYVLRLRSSPGMTSAGASLEEARSEMCELLLEVLPDEAGEEAFVRLEPDPPPPFAETCPGLHLSEFVEVSDARGWFWICNGKVDQLMQDEPCSVCKRQWWKRTASPLVIRTDPPGHIMLCHDSYGSTQVVSKEFRDALSAAERAVFDWMPVRTLRKSKRRWLEIIPRIKPIPYATIRGRPIFGERCSTCGFNPTSHGVFSSEMIRDYIAEKSEPDPAESLVVFGDEWNWRLGLRMSRFEEVRRALGVSGLIATYLGEIPSNLIARRPRYIDNDSTLKAWRYQWGQRHGHRAFASDRRHSIKWPGILK
jgi:predicted RNase H-like HicB family nuclease